MFSEAQYNAVISELDSGIVSLTTQLQKVGPVVHAACAHWYIPDWVADAFESAGRKLAEIGTSVLNTIKDLLTGAVAPIFFWIRSQGWTDGVGIPASQVAGNVAPVALRAQYDWSGEAASTYARATSSQTTAAAAVQTTASSVSSVLTVSAAGGLAFYIAIGGILVKLIMEFVAALGLIGSGALSPVGLALALESVTVTPVMIGIAVTATLTFLGVQASQLSAIKGADSMSAFPSGSWPVGTA